MSSNSHFSIPVYIIWGLGQPKTIACQQISMLSCHPNRFHICLIMTALFQSAAFLNPYMDKMISSVFGFVFNDLYNLHKSLLYACDRLVGDYAFFDHCNFFPDLLFLLVCNQDLTHSHINS